MSAKWPAMGGLGDVGVLGGYGAGSELGGGPVDMARTML